MASSFLLSSQQNQDSNNINFASVVLYHVQALVNGRATHTRSTALFPGLPGWVGTRKAKPLWILLKQETVSGSGISWAKALKSIKH